MGAAVNRIRVADGDKARQRGYVILLSVRRTNQCVQTYLKHIDEPSVYYSRDGNMYGFFYVFWDNPST